MKSPKLLVITLGFLVLMTLASCITIEPTPERSYNESQSNPVTSGASFRNKSQVRSEMCDAGYCLSWDDDTESYMYSAVSDGYMIFQDTLGDFGYLLDWTLLDPDRAAKAVFEWQWINGVRGADMDWVESIEERLLDRMMNSNISQSDDSCRGDLCCMVDVDNEGIMVTLCYWE